MNSDPRELKVGDLAMIVRSDGKCGCQKRMIGTPFEVLGIHIGTAPLICGVCQGTTGTYTNFAQIRKEGGNATFKGRWVPFAWIIKIDPPEKGGEEERFQPILTDKEKNDAEISAMKKGLKREFDKLSDQIKEITK